MKILTVFNYLRSKVRYYLFSPEYNARSLGVKLGKSCKISTSNFGSEPYLIEIGDHVHLTKGVSFITHDGGVWVFRQEIPDFDVFGKIKIGSNTYVGNNAVILPGVSIGKNCVIGAHSVITKNIPDNTVVAGSPGRYICSTDNYKQRMLLLNAKTKLKDSKTKRIILSSLDDNTFIRKTNLRV